jgi:glyoxylase-like metal-dependent hydrolase (beta-lactamase superfamily II)
MKRALVLGALVIVGALSAALGAAARVGQGAGQQPSAGALQVDKLKDNLYVLRGGGGNTAAFITANGVVLVDTKLPGWGKPLLEKVKELTDKPVTTIINTHTHFDHVSGNVDFPATVEVVTHENTAKLMREMRPPTGFPNAPPNMFEDSKGVGLPKRTFKDQMTLGSGNDRIELHYFGPAHTSGDTFVVFPTFRHAYRRCLPEQRHPDYGCQQRRQRHRVREHARESGGASRHRHRDHGSQHDDTHDGRPEDVYRLQSRVHRGGESSENGRPDD